MNKNGFLKRLLVLMAVLVAVSCLMAAVFSFSGCAQDKTDDQNGDQTGDQNNGGNGGNTDGNQNGGQNGNQNEDQNGGQEGEKGEALIPNQDCGHKLNKYGFCGTCQIDMSRVTVAIGKDITLEYHIAVHDPDLIVGRTLQVVINDGDHVEVITDLAPEANGYVFKYHGIAPHQMAHEVDAALMVVEGSELTVIDDILNYTVKKNIQELLTANEGNAEIVQILSDILRYGAAAQLYQNYEVDNLATDGITGLVPERTERPEKSDMKLTPVEGVVSNTYFNGATVWFGSTTRLKITIKTDDISKVTLKLNGTEVAADKLVAGDKEGTYFYYTDDIGMAHFADIYTFTVYDNGTEVKTLTYSVNSYVHSMMNSENEKMAALALALYRAGLSAAGWVANHPN